MGRIRSNIAPLSINGFHSRRGIRLFRDVRCQAENRITGWWRTGQGLEERRQLITANYPPYPGWNAPVKRLSCCREGEGVDRGNRCSIGRVLVGNFQGRWNGVTEDGRHACGRRFLGVTDKQSREKRPRHISFLAHERPTIEEDRAKKSNFQAIEAARLIRPEFARFSWDMGERLERTDCLRFSLRDVILSFGEDVQ